MDALLNERMNMKRKYVGLVCTILAVILLGILFGGEGILDLLKEKKVGFYLYFYFFLASVGGACMLLFTYCMHFFIYDLCIHSFKTDRDVSNIERLDRYYTSITCAVSFELCFFIGSFLALMLEYSFEKHIGAFVFSIVIILVKCVFPMGLSFLMQMRMSIDKSKSFSDIFFVLSMTLVCYALFATGYMFMYLMNHDFFALGLHTMRDALLYFK